MDSGSKDLESGAPPSTYTFTPGLLPSAFARCFAKRSWSADLPSHDFLTCKIPSCRVRADPPPDVSCIRTRPSPPPYAMQVRWHHPRSGSAFTGLPISQSPESAVQDEVVSRSRPFHSFLPPTGASPVCLAWIPRPPTV